MASVKNAVATYETKRKAERQRDENANTRAKGLPYRSGARPFGFERNRMSERKCEADLIRSGTAAVLSGASLYSVLQDWRSSGVLPVSGKPWSRATVKSILTRNSNAALVEHQGEILGEGVAEWARIVTCHDLESVQKILTYGGTKHHATVLLAGIAQCHCGETMVSNGKGSPPMYVCSARAKGTGKPGSAHVAIAQHLLDAEARNRIVSLYLLAPRTSEVANAEAANLAAHVRPLEGERCQARRSCVSVRSTILLTQAGMARDATVSRSWSRAGNPRR